MVWHATSPYISLWDEMYHFSYVQYAFNWDIPVPLDQMGSWSRYVFSCAEVYPNGFVTSLHCGEILPLESFPEAGRNSSAHWPPVYYYFVALLMRPVLWLMSEGGFHSGDFWLAARVSTAMIWALGCSALFVGTRKIFKTNCGALSVALVCSALPGFFYSGSFVTPYALTPLVVGVQLVTANLIFENYGNKVRFPIIAMIGVTALSVWALPQSMLTFVTLSLGLCISSGINFRTHINYSGDVISKFVTATKQNILYVLSGGIGYYSYIRWTEFQQSRSLPQPILPDGSFTSLEDNTFGAFESFKFFIWYAWPKSVYSWQFMEFKELVICAIWAAIATCFIFLALFHRSKLEFPFTIAIAFLICAPFFGLLYDRLLPFGPPMRYFLPEAILGLCFIAMAGQFRRTRNLVMLVTLVTYFISLSLPAFQNLHPV